MVRGDVENSDSGVDAADDESDAPKGQSRKAVTSSKGAQTPPILSSLLAEKLLLLRHTVSHLINERQGKVYCVDSS